MNHLIKILLVFLPLKDSFCMTGGRPGEIGEFPYLVSVHGDEQLCIGLIVDYDEVVVPGDCILKHKKIGSGKVIPYLSQKLRKNFTGLFMDTDLTNEWFTQWSLGTMAILANIIPLNQSDPDLREYYDVRSTDNFKSGYPIRAPLPRPNSELLLANEFSHAITVGSGWKVGAVRILSKKECADKLRRLMKKHNLGTSVRPYCVVSHTHKTQNARGSKIPPGQPCHEDLGAPLIVNDYVVGVLAWALCEKGAQPVALYVKTDVETVADITRNILNYHREAMEAIRPEEARYQPDFNFADKELIFVNDPVEKKKYGSWPHDGPLIVAVKRVEATTPFAAGCSTEGDGTSGNTGSCTTASTRAEIESPPAIPKSVILRHLQERNDKNQASMYQKVPTAGDKSARVKKAETGKKNKEIKTSDSEPPQRDQSRTENKNNSQASDTTGERRTNNTTQDSQSLTGKYRPDHPIFGPIFNFSKLAEVHPNQTGLENESRPTFPFQKGFLSGNMTLSDEFITGEEGTLSEEELLTLVEEFMQEEDLKNKSTVAIPFAILAQIESTLNASVYNKSHLSNEASFKNHSCAFSSNDTLDGLQNQTGCSCVNQTGGRLLDIEDEKHLAAFNMGQGKDLPIPNPRVEVKRIIRYTVAAREIFPPEDDDLQGPPRSVDARETGHQWQCCPLVLLVIMLLDFTLSG